MSIHKPSGLAGLAAALALAAVVLPSAQAQAQAQAQEPKVLNYARTGQFESLDPPRQFDIAVHHRKDRGDVGLVALAPRIVIGDHAQQRVRQLCLPREAGFGHRRHPDHLRPPGPVHPAFRAGRKLRTIDRDIGAAAMRNRVLTLGRIGQRGGQAGRRRARIDDTRREVRPQNNLT